jgi:hypothetical protein
MPDPTTTVGWIALALGSGVVAGLANNLLGFIRDQLGYSAKTAADRKANAAAAERQHNAQQPLVNMDGRQRGRRAALRRDGAFDAARLELIADALGVHEFPVSHWYHHFGGEYDFHLHPSSSTPTTLGDAAGMSVVNSGTAPLVAYLLSGPDLHSDAVDLGGIW